MSDDIEEYIRRVIAGQDTTSRDINVSVTSNNDTQILTEGTNVWSYEYQNDMPLKGQK